MAVTSSPELQEAVSRQLKYYLEVKRLEDGFDNSSVTQPRLQYPHYRTKSVMGGVQPLDRSLKQYFYFDPHLKTSLLNNKPKPGRIDYRKYYDYPNSRSALTNFGNFHRAIEATKEGSVGLLKEIFEKSKDQQWMLRRKNSDGVTLIHVATENKKNEILEWLLSQPGADCDVTSSLGYTAMHIAIINGFMDCAEILKRYNADINMKTLDGQSPLHLAASKNKIESVNWLLANGVDPEALDREGRSAIDIARKERFNDVVQAISNWINRDLARFFN